jgi:hypothetical protein
MNLFMHSYELLQMDKYFTKIRPDPEVAKRLEAILRWAQSHPDVAIMSIQQYYESELWQNHVAPTCPDMVPRFAHGGQLVIDLFNKIRYDLA